MKKQILRVVIFSSLIATGAGISTMTYADGTNSLDLTVNANITAGTCSASVVEGDTITDTIAFGNVYISEVYAKSKIKPFKLRFSDCVGLKDKKAKFRLAPNNVACRGAAALMGNSQMPRLQQQRQQWSPWKYGRQKPLEALAR